MIGYFYTIIESKPHYVNAKVYVIDSKDVPNILGINSCTRLRFVNFNQKILDLNSVEVEKKNVIDPAFHKLLDKFKGIFEGHGKLKDYEANL